MPDGTSEILLHADFRSLAIKRRQKEVPLVQI